MGLVIDTSALIAAERREGGILEAIAGVGDEAVALPAIVYAELLAGVRLADSAARAAARRAKIDALMHRVPFVPFGPAIAERWAEIFAALQRAGGSGRRSPLPARGRTSGRANRLRPLRPPYAPTAVDAGTVSMIRMGWSCL